MKSSQAKMFGFSRFYLCISDGILFLYYGLLCTLHQMLFFFGGSLSTLCHVTLLLHMAQISKLVNSILL